MINVIPTRMELTKAKKRLAAAIKGHRLLKDKRDELIKQFMERIYECRDLRTKVEGKLAGAQKDFTEARAEMPDEAINTALAGVKTRAQVRGETVNIMSVALPKLTPERYSTEPSYGYAFTAQALDSASETLRETFPDMVRLAEMEHSCRLMAEEIEKTRRRVNALEHVTIPETAETIRYIKMKLDENERSSQIRLMKVKDMMIERKIKTSG